MTRRKDTPSRVPAEPFVAWVRARHASLLRDDTLRLHEAAKTSPAVRHVSEDLGISDRAAFRYLRQLDGVNRPTTSYRRSLVQNMIEHAGCRFEEVYPDLDPEIEVEPLAFCPTCEDSVTPICGVCPWCETRATRPPRGVKLTKAKARVTDHQLRSLHLLHVNCRITVLDLARQTYARLGYPNPPACDMAIRRGWARLGLEGMSRSEAMRIVHARSEKPAPPISEAVFERAVWMHTEAGVSVNSIANLLAEDSTVSADRLGRWLRARLRERGVYRYVNRRGDEQVAA